MTSDFIFCLCMPSGESPASTNSETSKARTDLGKQYRPKSEGFFESSLISVCSVFFSKLTVAHTLLCLGPPSCFSASFSKDTIFCSFLFASMREETLP